MKKSFVSSKAAKTLLLVLLILAIILTVIHCVIQAIQAANVTIRDDIFETSVSFDIAVGCAVYGIIILLEYGIYSSIKYLIFEEDKKILRVIWEICKPVCSLLIVLYILQFIH